MYICKYFRPNVIQLPGCEIWIVINVIIISGLVSLVGMVQSFIAGFHTVSNWGEFPNIRIVNTKPTFMTLKTPVHAGLASLLRQENKSRNLNNKTNSSWVRSRLSPHVLEF